MLPEFDDMKATAFSIVLDVMGESAVWEQSFGGEKEGRILFKYPTQQTQIAGTDVDEYPPVTPTAEWYKDTFIKLKELSDLQCYEYLRIRENRYLVTKVETKTDGDTYIANLDLVTE